MLIVGLTGGIGSGKSSAAREFIKLGVRLVDSDVLARTVVEPGRSALSKIKERFGDGVINGDGTLLRERLADIVFHDGAALADLNAIVHPAVYAEMAREMDEYRKDPGDTILMLDIPLLYESGGDTIVDRVVVVWVDRETQIARLMARDGFSREAATNRIEKQMDLDEKKHRADFVVDNTGSFEDLGRRVGQVYEKLCAVNRTGEQGAVQKR
ncbi:MAG: dephospho-CoA kinase [Deltaproteobacteria bacterium]|nr:dephospho-CoA kinase [Candidatus Zymogenaceae bacterium]